MAQSSTSTKPVKVFRLRGVSASVFKNKSKAGDRDVSYHKVSVQRTYKDGDEFKTTTSFGRNDLPLVAHAVTEAWKYILDAEGRNGSDE